MQTACGLLPFRSLVYILQQKWSACSWLLLQEFVKMQQEAEKECEANGEAAVAELALPSIPYWRCRVIMTRPDFLQGTSLSRAVPRVLAILVS